MVDTPGPLPPSQNTTVHKATRLWPWLLIAIFLALVVHFLRPEQTGVLVYQVSKVALGAWLAYFIDVSLFANVWPHLDEEMPRDVVMAARIVARALTFVAVIQGMGSLG